MRDPQVIGEYLGKSYEQLQNIIQLIDTKANIILGVIGVVLSLFFSTVFMDKNVTAFWVYIILVPFLLSGFFSFLTLYPRASKKKQVGESLLYYDLLVNMDNTSMIKKLQSDGAEKFIYEDYLNSLKALSKIIRTKLFYVRLSYIFLAIGVFIKLVIEFRTWSF